MDASRNAGRSSTTLSRSLGDFCGSQDRHNWWGRERIVLQQRSRVSTFRPGAGRVQLSPRQTSHHHDGAIPNEIWVFWVVGAERHLDSGRQSLDRMKWEQVAISGRRATFSTRVSYCESCVELDDRSWGVAMGESVFRAYGVSTLGMPVAHPQPQPHSNTIERIRDIGLDADQTRHATPPTITLVGTSRRWRISFYSLLINQVDVGEQNNERSAAERRKWMTPGRRGQEAHWAMSTEYERRRGRRRALERPWSYGRGVIVPKLSHSSLTAFGHIDGPQYRPTTMATVQCNHNTLLISTITLEPENGFHSCNPWFCERAYRNPPLCQIHALTRRNARRPCHAARRS